MISLLPYFMSKISRFTIFLLFSSNGYIMVYKNRVLLADCGGVFPLLYEKEASPH